MSNFLDKFIKEKIIGPIIKPFQEKIEVQDNIIKIQQEKIGLTPRHFAVPLGMSSVKKTDMKRARNINFKLLRALSESYDVARACINRRKRQERSY